MIKTSLIKQYINQTIKEILSDPPLFEIEKSSRIQKDNSNKLSLLQNEWNNINRELKSLVKKMNGADEDEISTIAGKIKYASGLRKEIEIKIQELQ